MSPDLEFLIDQLSGLYRPRPSEGITPWVLRTIRLPTIEGKYSGMPYDVSRSPLVQHFFDWWQDNESRYHEYVTMKGSQDGRTLAAIMATCYDFAHEPASTLYLSNSDGMAAAVGKNRFVPCLKQADPSISEDIEDSGEAAVFKIIRGALFLCSGGNVPTRLISWPISRVHVDEASAHQVSSMGTTMDLAEKRTEKQSDRKINIFSKPEEWPVYRANTNTKTLERVSGPKSVFTDRWMRGTQSVPMVPCPFCGKRQELTDTQLRAPAQLLPGLDGNAMDLDLERIEAEAWYECVHCALPIKEEHKAKMVAAYEMQPAPLDPAEAKKLGFARPRRVAFDPRHPEIVMYRRPAPGVYSLHTSDLYNLTSDTCTFGAILKKKLLAERSPETHAIYSKDVLGLPPPEDQRKVELNSKLLGRLRGVYKRFRIVDPLTNAITVPAEPLPCEAKLLSLTIDYQQGSVGASSYFPWVLCAFDDQWRMWVVDYGTCFSLDDLEDIVRMEFKQPNGAIKKIGFGLMDSQHDPGTVQDFCKRDSVYLRIWPSRGVSRNAQIEVVDLSTKTGFPFWVYNYLSNYWEEQLYRWLLGAWTMYLDPNKPGMLHTVKAQKHAQFCPRPFLPLDSDEDFFEQLANMHETYIDEKHPEKGLHWDKIHPSKPNDFGDMCKLQLIIRRHFQQQAKPHPVDARLQAS